MGSTAPVIAFYPALHIRSISSASAEGREMVILFHATSGVKKMLSK
jgi:hypothetical protein